MCSASSTASGSSRSTASTSLARSQYLPFFSRLGPYDPALLDRARDRAPRRLVEYWAHEASLVPPSTWPLLDFRMRAAAEKAWGGMRRILEERPDYVDLVRAEVEARGPMTAREVEVALAHDQPRRTDHWGWNWSDVKQALEYLFWAGQISSVGAHDPVRATVCRARRHRATAAAGGLDRPAGPEADPDRHLELVRIAARAHGVGTELCLADYFRIKREDARPAIARLVADGELIPVTVPGWKPAWLHAEARLPRRVHAEALLSPFDSLVWQRERIHALWDFHYRIEIYTPAQKRVHGYYVLPFLYGDALVARCDLKADRVAGRAALPPGHVGARRACRGAPGPARQPRVDGRLARTRSRRPAASTCPPAVVAARSRRATASR